MRLALPLLLVLALAAPAAGQRPAGAELRDSQRRLAEVRREREELRAEMDRIRGRVHDLSSEVGNLERQVGTSAAVLRELEYQVTERESLIDQNRRDMRLTRQVLAQRRAVLDRRLRDIYKRGPLHTVAVLLGAESFSDLIHRYKYLLLIARHDRLLVQEVRDLERQLAARQRDLGSSLLELASVREERSREHGALTSLESRQQRALATARTTEQTTARRIQRLADDERRLGSLVATADQRRLEAGSRPAPAAADRTATLTPRDRGTLPWPVEGPVLYRFGGAPGAGGATLRWNGIGIGAAAGAPVRAVAAGVVVLAGPFEGYGPTVVLGHGGGYYSLYLYLRETSVREGDRVQRSQAVGTVGGQATPEGPHVEFQIRAPGGEAVDPLAWLQSRGR